MPTYDYECTKCGATFELFQSITAKAKRRVKPEEKSCACDAPVRRLIGTGGGIIFKGSGFYQTDYRSDSYRKAAQADSTSSSSSSSSDTEKKSDTKTSSGEKTTTKTTGADSKPGAAAKKDAQKAAT